MKRDIIRSVLFIKMMVATDTSSSNITKTPPPTTTKKKNYKLKINLVVEAGMGKRGGKGTRGEQSGGHKVSRWV